MDTIAEFVKGDLRENNISSASYYKVHKLVFGLGFSYHMIDVCINNFMIYWRKDEIRSICRFCRKSPYHDKSGRVSVPYREILYLPLTDRLKQLYQSKQTAWTMGWYVELIRE